MDSSTSFSEVSEKVFVFVLFQRLFLLEDQAYSNTKVSMQVNTSQHESETIQHKSAGVWHESTRINTSLMSQHESTQARHESTRINASLKQLT